MRNTRIAANVQQRRLRCANARWSAQTVRFGRCLRSGRAAMAADLVDHVSLRRFFILFFELGAKISTTERSGQILR
jgi:hypothetical protein